MNENEINAIGRTAFLIAACRSIENDKKVSLFKDPYAKYFVNPEIISKAIAFEGIIPVGVQAILYRTKYFYDKLSACIHDGIKQVVMLGSGFDLKCQDCVDSSVSFYDVDQPSVLQFKDNVLDKNGIKKNAKSIGCDYIKEPLIEKLKASGFDTQIATVFLWEGNVHYVEKSDIKSLLIDLRNNLDHFFISFDYLTDTVINRTTPYPAVTQAANFFSGLGSPWITGYDDISVLSKATFLTLLDTVSMEVLEHQYCPEAKNSLELLSLYSVSTLKK